MGPARTRGPKARFGFGVTLWGAYHRKLENGLVAALDEVVARALCGTVFVVLDDQCPLRGAEP